MNKKLVGILLMTLLIATALPVVGTMNTNENLEGISIDDCISLKQTFVKSSVMASWSQQSKLITSDGDSNDYFGSSNSIDGDFAIIGSYGDDDLGPDSGSAYIFKRSGVAWSQHFKLTAADGVGGDAFGCSVSISEDRVIIGAYGDDENGFYSGSAYVFKNSGATWFQEVKITASDGAIADWFGAVVSISGEYAIIGAPLDDDKGTDSGSAYIFIRSGNSWTQQAKLTALDGASADYFGFCVAIDGEYAIIGAYADDDKGIESGSAYIFKRSGTTWTQEAKVTASDGAVDDWFGQRVSICGDYVVIGAYKNDDSGFDSGSAYIFKRSGTTWSQEAKLLASDAAMDDWFGYSVAIDRDRAIIGAHLNDDFGATSGSAYVFKRTDTTWSEEAKIIALDGAEGDYFGGAVSIDGIYALAGASSDDDNGLNSGSAYVFVRSNQPPSAPIITGTSNGKPETEYEFTFNSVDPDGDDVRYFIQWGDTTSEWTGFYPSGTLVKVKHKWSTDGDYNIIVKAQDKYGSDSTETLETIKITTPRTRTVYHPLLLQLFERFPNAFPILRIIIPVR